MDGIAIPIISLWQPWATACVTPHPDYPQRGIKEFETRHFTTKVRGKLLIHAAKKWDKDNKMLLNTERAFMVYRGFLGEMEFGCIVGFVDVMGVITSEEFHDKGPRISKSPQMEFGLGNWEPNRFGWQFANPVKFRKPIEMKGMQGFWKVPLSTIPTEYHSLFIQ